MHSDWQELSLSWGLVQIALEAERKRVLDTIAQKRATDTLEDLRYWQGWLGALEWMRGLAERKAKV